ncbi:MAG: hypothetical protein OXF83_07715 [Anaerolineaceae bacterium]|nr:hypothetical protein [Anaerolineaceae bacterium]
MRNPAGEECRYYYQDYHRGRAIRECRNVLQDSQSQPWLPTDCQRCPVPAILRANADPSLELQVSIERKWLGFKRELKLSARCQKHQQTVADPYVGCDACRAERPGLDLFRSALTMEEDPDDS